MRGKISKSDEQAINEFEFLVEAGGIVNLLRTMSSDGLNYLLTLLEKKEDFENCAIIRDEINARNADR